jgi:hypothetical protein
VFPPYGALAGELILRNIGGCACDALAQVRRFLSGAPGTPLGGRGIFVAQGAQCRRNHRFSLQFKHNHPHRPDKSARFKIELEDSKLKTRRDVRSFDQWQMSATVASMLQPQYQSHARVAH